MHYFLELGKHFRKREEKNWKNKYQDSSLVCHHHHSLLSLGRVIINRMEGKKQRKKGSASHRETEAMIEGKEEKDWKFQDSKRVVREKEKKKEIQSQTLSLTSAKNMDLKSHLFNKERKRVQIFRVQQVLHVRRIWEFVLVFVSCNTEKNWWIQDAAKVFLFSSQRNFYRPLGDRENF